MSFRASPKCPLSQVIPSTDNSKTLFRILENGSIVLNGSLSYNNKSAFYQLQLKACVSGGVGRARGAQGCGAGSQKAFFPFRTQVDVLITALSNNAPNQSSCPSQ